MTTAELIHFLGTWTATVCGLQVVFSRKGTWMHRWVGRGYVTASVIVSLAALGMATGPASFGLFQVLALLCLGLLGTAVAAMRSGPRTKRRLTIHGYAMSFSLACVGAAGFGALVGATEGRVNLIGGVVLGVGLVFVLLSPVRRSVRRTLSAI